MARVAGAARGLHARRRLITLGGWAVALALAGALLGVLGVRLAMGAAWWWAVPVAMAGAGGLVAVAAVWPRRWSLAHAAGEVDRANATDSALRTALEIDEADGDPALVAMARARGERVAASADPARAVPPSQPDGWWWAIGLGAACLVAGLFVPPIDRAASIPDAAPQVRRAAEQVQTAVTETAAVDPAALPDPASWSRVQEELEELENELRRGEGNADAPARTAAALDAAAEELDRQNELAARERQALRDRADTYRPDERQGGSELSERLADALARNDLLAAEEAARAIDQAAERMTDAERDALMRSLEDLASTLDPPPAGDDRTPTTESDQTSGAIPDPEPSAAGADREPASERPPEVGDEPSPPAEPTGTPRADESERAEETRAEEAPQPQDRPRTLPEALRDRANELREPDRAREPRDQGQEGQDQGQRRSPDERPGSQEPVPSEQTDGSRRDGQRQGPGQREQPGTRPSQEQGQTEAQEQPQEQGSQQTERNGQQQGQQQSQQEGQQQQGQSRQGQQEGQQQGQQRDQTQGQKQPGQNPAERPSDSGPPGRQPGQQTGDQTEGRTGEPSDAPGEQRGAGEPPPGSVERAVRDLRGREQAREQNQRVAESLRERARDLIDPGARDRPDGTGGPDGSDAPITPRDFAEIPPDAFEPVDASRPAPAGSDDSSRVVGEWFDPERTDVPAGERRAAAGEMRRAARRARDAVDNQQVPRRYRDLIQRVFDRVDRRAEEVGGPVAPQGEDAP